MGREREQVAELHERRKLREERGGDELVILRHQDTQQLLSDSQGDDGGARKLLAMHYHTTFAAAGEGKVCREVPVPEGVEALTPEQELEAVDAYWALNNLNGRPWLARSGDGVYYFQWFTRKLGAKLHDGSKRDVLGDIEICNPVMAATLNALRSFPGVCEDFGFVRYYTRGCPLHAHVDNGIGKLGADGNWGASSKGTYGQEVARVMTSITKADVANNFFFPPSPYYSSRLETHSVLAGVCTVLMGRRGMESMHGCDKSDGPVWRPMNHIFGDENLKKYMAAGGPSAHLQAGLSAAIKAHYKLPKAERWHPP